MSTTRKALAAIVLGMIALTVPMQAQNAEPVKFSLGGGIGVPTGDFDDAFKVGWQGVLAASYTLANAPVGFQLEGAFSRFHDDQPAASLKENLYYGTGNLMYQIRIAGAPRVLPYIIGGGGIYYIDPTGRDGTRLDSQTEFGFNVGAGVDLDAGRVNLFLESRFHNVLDGLGTSDLQFNNVTAGVRFGVQ